MLVYADATARDAALPSPADGMVCVISGLNMLTIYDATASEWRNAPVFYADAASGATGSDVIAAGDGAAQNSSGDNVTALGFQTGASSSGNNIDAHGYQAAKSATGNYIAAVGSYAAHSCSGSYVSASGYFAAYQAKGSYIVASGYAAARQTYENNIIAHGQNSADKATGTYVLAVGDGAATKSDASRIVAIGAAAFDGWTDDAGNAVTFDDSDVSGNVITITNHGLEDITTYKSIGDYIWLKLTEGDGACGDLTSGEKYLFEITSDDTVTCQTDIGTVGSQTGHTLTPREMYHKSVAIGDNAEPDAANQVMIGGSTVTQVKTPGAYTPGTMADASAPNNSIYYSSDQSALCYKDSGGVTKTIDLSAIA